MDCFDVILGVTWIDKYMMALYRKGVNVVMVDMQGREMLVECTRLVKGPTGETVSNKQLDTSKSKVSAMKSQDVRKMKLTWVCIQINFMQLIKNSMYMLFVLMR